MRGTARSTCVLLLLCIGCEPAGDLDPRFVELELGVDVDLEAAIDIGPVYAVGANTVARTSWVEDEGGSWQLSERLHDIASVGRHVVVVGDAGFVAVAPWDADPQEDAFVEHPTGLSTDLVAVTGYGDPDVTMVAVGDGVLSVGQGDPNEGPLVWSTPEAPSGEWGNLRDIRLAEDQICALGDAGALFCASLSELTWQRVELETDANLTRFCAGPFLWLGIGSDGTWVSGGQDGAEWNADGDGDPDMVTCSFGDWGLLTVSPTGVVEVENDLGRERWNLGFRPLAIAEGYRLILVGEHGRAVLLRDSDY